MSQDFTQWYASLAVEGETALILRQKPVLDADGNHQYHIDGAVKATWPAMLPNARLRDGWAVYGNTGAFLPERFPEGRPVAQMACIDSMLCMVLDDVGTPKCPTPPPLPPSWVMETSPDCYQWGYAFTPDGSPTKAEGSVLMPLLAARGYTDPGACNPVRNFRLPGSANLKRQHGGFKARLVEWHPDRRYTLQQVLDAFGVELGEVPDVVTRPPIRVTDDGADPVLAWLSAQGLVLSPANVEGWCDVVCPNAEAHTDGNPSGRYNPALHAYCCLHSHCLHLDTRTFLDWCESRGAPAAQTGIRPELMSKALSALSTLPKGTAMEADALASAEAAAAAVSRRQADALSRTEWFTRYGYVLSDNCFFDYELRRELSRAAFDALFRHIKCVSRHSNKARQILPSTWYDEQRADSGVGVLHGLTYAPGDSEVVEHNGERLGNRWRDARPAPGDGDVGPFLAHAELLVPDAAQREHLFDVMAFKVQHPRIKINHAILHGGVQGCGKDSLWMPFIYAVCGPHRLNLGMTVGDAILSAFQYELESEVLVLNELKEPEASQRRALANRLKPIIAAPPDTLSINRKGLHPYFAPNRVFVLSFSNDRIPISLDSQDRRWCCIWSSAPRMSEADAERLHAWYRAGGLDAVAGWLHRRDVSRFNPAATPMMTEWKAALVSNSMSQAESYLVEMMQTRAGPFSSGLVASPFHALVDALQTMVPSGVRIVKPALLHALDEAGWIDRGLCGSAANSTKKQIYCHPALASWSKSALRDALDKPPSGLHAVK